MSCFPVSQSLYFPFFSSKLVWGEGQVLVKTDCMHTAEGVLVSWEPVPLMSPLVQLTEDTLQDFSSSSCEGENLMVRR